MVEAVLMWILDEDIMIIAVRVLSEQTSAVLHAQRTMTEFM